MTISLKLSVNSSYKATIIHTVDGVVSGNPQIVLGVDGGTDPVEAHIDFRHGSVNVYTITEEYVPRIKPVEATEVASTDEEESETDESEEDDDDDESDNYETED